MTFPESTPGAGVAVAEAPDVILAEVLVYHGSVLLAKYAIEHGEYIIGRDPSCPIPVNADQVSRHHARLTFTAFELLVEDLGSSNGVFIEGVQVQIPTRVRADQEVQIGSARLIFRLKDDASRQLVAALWDKDLGLETVRTMLTGPKYRNITTIGRGGMGIVTQARDLRIRRTVAIKAMKTGSQFSRENVLRFIDEAQVTGQLDHPNIVPVYEFGIDDHGEIFYAMKYVKGTTLDEVLRGIRHRNARLIEKYPLATLITIFQKICDAMAFAHSKGVVHRDLKPDNVMIGAYGEVLVMDWGLAKNMTAGARPAGSVPPENSVETIAAQPLDELRGFETLHGLVVGTPPYISPEQARGEIEKIDARSDVFVLGEILYAMLTLRAPVSGSNAAEVIQNLLGSKISPPISFNTPPKTASAGGVLESDKDHIALLHCPGQRVPDGLSAVVMKAMHHEPEKRYQSVDEMQEDITAWQGGFATKAERAGLRKQLLLFAARRKTEVALFGLGLVVLIAVVIGFIYQLAGEKNRALASEKRAVNSELLAADRLAELRGTAPTFYAEAASLAEERRFDDALDKINYAIAQVPNSAEYHNLRGNVLQAMLRLDEAVDAYEAALARNAGHRGAAENLELTRRVIAKIGEDGRVPDEVRRELHNALMAQRRRGEAIAVLGQLEGEREHRGPGGRPGFARRGMRRSLESTDDSSVMVDLSRVVLPDLRKLHEAPVTALTLDDTRLPDLSPLRGVKLQRLSVNRTLVRDLSPLIGMPLRWLSIESTPVANLNALATLPLEALRLNGTRIDDLTPLRGRPLEQLNASGCLRIRDLKPLDGLPLQIVDLSRTGISDLRPLTNSPVRELNLDGCAELYDLTPLMDIPTLEGVLIPTQCKEVSYLRSHPTLKRLSYKKQTQTVAEFFAELDAGAGK